MSSTKTSTSKPSVVTNFATAGLGGMIGWCFIHPLNTIAIRLNLASSSAGAKNPSFVTFVQTIVREQGILSLFAGLEAGLLRQVFYATSRLGLFEVFRDEMAKRRPTDMISRLIAGVCSGGLAALISCPAEVTLVRMSNDVNQPIERRRNYTSVSNAFQRIMKEEGLFTFFRGSGPFVNRAMVVGAVQVGSYDQLREKFRKLGVSNPSLNVFYASMVSGLLYSVITMPLETAKNRMAFQSADKVTGERMYKSALQTMSMVAKHEGILQLWTGFFPYYLRCGGHTVLMFMSIEWLRGLVKKL